MRFDDIAYVDEYKKSGKYPKIHDDIFSLDANIPVGNVIDLGCCTGLLSVRLAQRHNLVIGIEPNKEYIKNAVPHERCVYMNFKIDYSNLKKLEQVILENHITTIYARRVLPEICDAGGIELVRDMIAMFRDCGVKNCVIEGRKCNSKSVHKLKNLSKEMELFQGFYSVKVCIRIAQYLLAFSRRYCIIS